jgi:hypothetical protein
MRTNIIFLTLLFLIANSVSAQDKPIHFVKTKEVEFVRGGGIESITLEINATSFTSPFSWSVTVTNASGILFVAERNDERIDSFFGENGYVTDCNNYTDCKNKWYFKELVKSIAGAPQVQPPRQSAPEDWELEALDSLGSEYLRQRKLAPQKIETVVSEMKQSLSKGYSKFVVPISPVEDDSSFMYVQSLNYFVPYWND